MPLTIVLVNLALGIFASPAPQAKSAACTPGGLTKGSETPVKDTFDDGKAGSGPYPAHYVQDGPTSGYTLYAPKTPPPDDVKLPVLVYATCGRQGTEYKNILNEVASRGYIVIAAGPPRGMGGSAPSASPASKSPYPPTDAGNMKFAIDWIKAGNGKKYGNIDADNIATGGLSCGGLAVRLSSSSLTSLADYIPVNGSLSE
jgi:predicted dienelactone hydrolase